MDGSFRTRWMATVALVGTVIATVLLAPTKTTATNLTPVATMLAHASIVLDPPTEYEMPLCTDLTKVLVQPGYIVTATTTDPNSRRANLRTQGNAKVDGTQKGDGYELDWTELVDLGGFYNAGAYPATIVFSSELVIDLEPGEVVFTSSTHTEANLKTNMAAAGWTCECRCMCSCAGSPTHNYNCGTPPQACSTGTVCSYQSCIGTWTCTQLWTYACSP